MPTYATAVKNAQLKAMADLFDLGDIQILNKTTVLATFPLGDQSGTVSNATWNLNLVYDTVKTVNSGTPTNARLRDSNGTVLISDLTVGSIGSGADVILDNFRIFINRNIKLNTVTIQYD
jgi:hypothetical protein